MTTSAPNRQLRKRLANRQRISDIATRLFFERGFDAVRIEEIAEAADVSRMTVFNHFSRKEDLFFDQDEGGREELFAALRQKDPAVSPVEALRQFAHWAVANKRPYVRFYESVSGRFMATIQASDTLKARARAIRDELTAALSSALAETAARPQPDAAANLAASLLVATWMVALLEAQRAFQQDQGVDRANEIFLQLIDRGTEGVNSALKGTPYV